MHSFSLLTLATAALALPAPEAQFGRQIPQPGAPVAYFLDNSANGSSVVSLQIEKNGSLSNPYRTSTLGKGSITLFCADASPNGLCAPPAHNSSQDPVDGAGAQGSLTVSGNYLFTVNIGSNTLAMFHIDPLNPYKPKMVGQPVDTLGDFPMSVDYSPKLRQACVLNGGEKAGVTCYDVNPVTGLKAIGGLRTLSKDIINQTTPASGITGSAAQILFNPDSTAVFVTIKGNGFFPPLRPGWFLAYPVTNGQVSSAAPITSQKDDVRMNFGFQFLSPNKVFMADSSYGFSLFDVSDDFKLTETAHTKIPNQEISCWTQYEPTLNSIYSMDGDSNTVTIADPKTGNITGGILAQTPDGNKTVGIFDSAIKNGKMYSLAATNGLLTFDLKSKSQQQYLDLSSFGERPNYQGFAVWPAGRVFSGENLPGLP